MPAKDSNTPASPPDTGLVVESRPKGAEQERKPSGARAEGVALPAALGRHLELLGLALQSTGLAFPEVDAEGALRAAFLQSLEAWATELRSGDAAVSPCAMAEDQSCHERSSCFAAQHHPNRDGSDASLPQLVKKVTPRASQPEGQSPKRHSISFAGSTRWDNFDKETDKRGLLARAVTSSRFETLFACLILFNTVALIVEEQFQGSATGYDLHFYDEYGSYAYNEKYMPDAQRTFNILHVMFATIFSVEALLRMLGRGWDYWRDRSELMDLFVVLCSNASLLVDSYASIDITLFRLLRLAKLLRIIKLIRTVKQLDSLQLMTTALYASISALCWAVVLLMLMQSFVALILTNIFRSQYLLPVDQLNSAQKEELFMYFGTYARSMLSTFELMLANWPPICRFLTENLNEGWMVIVIAYKLVFGFAFISVINAVFMQETLNVAVTDDNIMIKAKMRATQDFQLKMEKLLRLADTNRDGFLSLAEFKAVLQKPAVKTWLESMDMDPGDGKLLFRLLDQDGDDSLSASELTKGFGKLKGQAKSLDTQLIVHALRKQWFNDVNPAIGDEVLVDRVSNVFTPPGLRAHHCPSPGVSLCTARA